MTNDEELIDRLVKDLAPVGRHALRMRLAYVVMIGLAGAVVALAVSFAFRPNGHHVTFAAFWVKFLYTAGLMGATIVALERIARPDGSIGSLVRISVAAFGLIVLLSVVQLSLSPVSSYSGLILGHTAILCPFLILGFGMPAFFANMWFLNRAAPLDPQLAGFVAGACAGAVGGWVYSWACNENGVPFIAIWYTFGIVLSGLLGGVVGRFMLRW